MAQHYKCAACGLDYSSTGVAVDHISPVVGAEGFTTWETFIHNLFCQKENLQVLCNTCHAIKTLKEKGERNKN